MQKPGLVDGYNLAETSARSFVEKKTRRKQTKTQIARKSSGRTMLGPSPSVMAALQQEAHCRAAASYSEGGQRGVHTARDCPGPRTPSPYPSTSSTAAAMSHSRLPTGAGVKRREEREREGRRKPQRGIGCRKVPALCVRCLAKAQSRLDCEQGPGAKLAPSSGERGHSWAALPCREVEKELCPVLKQVLSGGNTLRK